jgi:heavy metal sensor kinase
MRQKRLGTRLVFSYILLAAGIMAVFTAGTATLLFFQMRSQSVRFAVQDIETVEGLLAFTPDGRVILREDYHNHAESRKVVDRYVEVLAPSGMVLYRNDRLGAESLGGMPAADEGVGGYSPRRTRLMDDTPVLLVSRRHVLGGHPILIRVGLSEEAIFRAVELFAVAAGLMFPVVIGAAALAAGRMSRRILAPIQDIAVQAGQITSNRLHERIPIQGTGDEIDQLATVFNQALTRLDESFRQLRQFTADASHELRTPLAAIRAIGEVGLDRDGSKQEYRELVGSMLEEVNRLTRLVDDLLTISRGDSGSIRLNCSRVRVIDLAHDTMSLLEPLADDKEQTLALTGDQTATVDGDPIFLRQAVINVVHNAIKYSPRQATIKLTVDRDTPGFVTLSVRDTGPGIAPEHRTRIFDRFYRVDRGRSRDAGGFGLGLAIAQWAVEAHKGSILVSSTPGDGSTFRISLPDSDRGRADSGP